MFTGIVTDVGRIRSVEQKGDVRIVIETAYDTQSIDLGASIACAGVCLTVVDKGQDQSTGWFAVDVSRETLSCTALGDWRPGVAVNLERSLRVGDEMGGHIVSGHVDGVGEILEITPKAGSKEILFSMPDDIAPYIARKGSVTVNGVSLTVNAVSDPPGAAFSVNMIPHTLMETSFRDAGEGDRVNLEIDILARYLARLSGRD
ncbi:riboflavin synthase subunit alpha [Iodidimonas muriae]|uniref:Riboflavin synthase n=1 Tax=Iodidimonas muriae TaxID=261467 RepID=A0ABQ2LG08_9PROT|nr:riboflavin synthase [Iodidimonas muriae]GER08327.1 riboflavin synthase subunit alpha [Kordiimonadales bacterium JCM 17843]GGO16277.1 riboflavin synthase subunit alpha [Iodidimonas muriae]